MSLTLFDGTLTSANSLHLLNFLEWLFILSNMCLTHTTHLKLNIRTPDLNWRELQWESWAKPLACQGFYSGLHWYSVGVQPRPRKFSEDFSCAPIDLIKSFFTLHWLQLHGSNSPYVSTLSDSTRGSGDAQLRDPSQQKSASLLCQCAANGFGADVYTAHSNSHAFAHAWSQICPGYIDRS